MAENSFLWTTNGTGDGPSGGYTQAQWAKIAKILASVHGPNGLSVNALNAFANSLATNQITIQSGQAIVDGKPYENDSNVNVTIPSAVGGGNTRIDRVVLRANWSAQTVRVTRIAGTDAASPTVPAITTTSENTYDIKLYQVRVNTSGTVTIEVDEREWGQLVTNAILNGAIDDTKVGNRVPSFIRRVGNSTDWNDPGTTVFTPTTVKMQGGVVQVTIANGAREASATVTFPVAYTNRPIVIGSFIRQFNETLFSNAAATLQIEATGPGSNTSFSVRVYLPANQTSGSGIAFTISWLAFGQ